MSSVGEEQLEFSYFAGEGVKCYIYFGKLFHLVW